MIAGIGVNAIVKFWKANGLCVTATLRLSRARAVGKVCFSEHSRAAMNSSKEACE